MVTRDDGEVFWNEKVTAADFETGHFRRCLADRLGWAVADAEGPNPVDLAPIRPAPRSKPSRVLQEDAAPSQVAVA
jgi:hypothetical protein